MSIKVVIPQIGQSVAEATIIKWYKSPGDFVEKGETLVEIGTDKIDTDIPSPVSGTVESLLVSEGDTVPVETEIAVLSGDAETVATVSADSHSAAEQERMEVVKRQDEVRTSPLVRKLAREYGINLSGVTGTGSGGRVTRDDVLRMIKGQDTKPSDQVPLERVPMSRMRKLIADHMIQSRRTAADLTTFFEVDMTEVVRQREAARKAYSERGVKLTYLPFVIVAVTRALQAYPVINSSVEEDAVIYRKEYNIGVATALEEGLIVPVIRQANRKNLLELSQELQQLSEKARMNRLTPGDIEGGTFTITNPGMFGALMGTPIIHQPQVAILEVGSIVKRPVVIDNEEIVVRSMAFFSLTYDHRAMDGATAHRFMSHVKNTLERECPDPMSALERK